MTDTAEDERQSDACLGLIDVMCLGFTLCDVLGVTLCDVLGVNTM